jgi:hypothetical protein
MGQQANIIVEDCSRQELLKETPASYVRSGDPQSWAKSLEGVYFRV